MDCDILIVGAGFYGATMAEQLANAGHSCLIIDKRNHIAGNAFTEVDEATGIEIHRYGAHIFHTPNKKVWDYVNRFATFTSYQHRVFTVHNNNVYSMPINLGTVASFFGRNLTPNQARDLIKSQAAEVQSVQPSNLEEKAISLIGRPLYEAFIRGYTAKQWQTDPRALPQNIIERLPVRYNFDNRYFNDAFEGLPENGYTALIANMIDHSNIRVQLGIDYFDIKNEIKAKKIIYTGPIDRFFDYQFGELGWRTIDFEWERVDAPDFQGTSVMNYADEDVPFTRIIEFKHFHPQREYRQEKTIITREYSRFATREDEPYYPVRTDSDKLRYGQYREMAAQLPHYHFGGRLGTYHYLDMHQAIGSALNDSEKLIRELGTLNGG